MKFEDLANKVPKIKKLPLPGESAHLEMAPEMRITELKALSQKPSDYRRAGVMALFYPGPDELARLLFILRNAYLTDMRRNRFRGEYDETVAERILTAPAGQEEPEDVAEGAHKDIVPAPPRCRPGPCPAARPAT